MNTDSNYVVIEDNKLLITCRICGKKYKNIGAHLKVHEISPSEYLIKFPGAPLVSDAAKFSMKVPKKSLNGVPVIPKEIATEIPTEDFISDVNTDTITYYTPGKNEIVFLPVDDNVNNLSAKETKDIADSILKQLDSTPLVFIYH